ncbi:hypothetical protein SAMN05428977_10309 [Nitrosomonas sp. Nm166]|nr:hypothetical protein SAMN05428977_10309 [Nitrosomonas sp. Nm166]
MLQLVREVEHVFNDFLVTLLKKRSIINATYHLTVRKVLNKCLCQRAAWGGTRKLVYLPDMPHSYVPPPLCTSSCLVAHSGLLRFN